jgi:L-iditol 2-dehydrogenase
MGEIIMNNSTLGRALVAAGDGKIEIRSVSVDYPTEWDIQVQLERSAISIGTESHIVRNIASAESPFIVGYAPVARVEAVGASAARYFAKGDRVIYFAPNKTQTGPAHSCGGHQSPAVLNVNPEIRDLLGPDQFCVLVPDGLTSEHAAFAGIAAVSSMGATMPGTEPGDKVLVLGQGLIGQFAAQHFRLRGAEVTVCDINKKRLAISSACGADHVINSAEQDTVKAVHDIWDGGADIIADTTGSYRVIESTLNALKRRGRYVFLGWCKGQNFNLERFHGQKVFEAFFPWTLEGAHVLHSLRMLKHGGLRAAPIITHSVDISEAPFVYDKLLNGSEEHLGVVFNWENTTNVGVI